eukprot:7031246-Prymnesium_polylepis.1
MLIQSHPWRAALNKRHQPERCWRRTNKRMTSSVLCFYSRTSCSEASHSSFGAPSCLRSQQPSRAAPSACSAACSRAMPGILWGHQGCAGRLTGEGAATRGQSMWP